MASNIARVRVIKCEFVTSCACCTLETRINDTRKRVANIWNNDHPDDDELKYHSDKIKAAVPGVEGYSIKGDSYYNNATLCSNCFNTMVRAANVLIDTGISESAIDSNIMDIQVFDVIDDEDEQKPESIF